MRKPESAKKTSTPRKPPGSQSGSAWKTSTAVTAIARTPSSPGRWTHVDARDRCDAGASSAVVVMRGPCPR